MGQKSDKGVLLRAENGDVIRYDETGLVLRLSEKVIADIAMRIGVAREEEETPQAPATSYLDPHEFLDGIDAWDLRQDGEWLYFNARLPGRQGVRGYRRLAEGGHVLADAPGPLYGILGLGGARAALANQAVSGFPQHILAPADDIGAVGHAGVEEARGNDALEQLREMTHEALVAETLLDWQMQKHQALRLFSVRVESDQSASAEALSQGVGFDNLLTAAGNLALAAARLGKKPELLCVSLDFALEDRSENAEAYRDGMLALMNRAEAELFNLGFHNPCFVARFESGSAEITQAPAIEGQWQLAWNHGDHRFLYSAPGYMFALDAYDRPTEDSRREMAEMTAAAVSDAENWRCPTFHLAEQSQSNPSVIQATARALGELVIDDADPFGAGETAGFRLIGAENGIEIIKVERHPEDAQAILLTCDKPPEGANLRLAYAYGADPREGAGYPANTGAVRDGWSLSSATGRELHRWALPCLLPVTQGGNNA